MTETLAGVSPSKNENLLEQASLAQAAVADVSAADPVAEERVDLAQPSEDELAIARELVRSARSRGVAMTGPGGMLKAFIKTVIETALDEEMVDHLGYDKHEVAWSGRRHLPGQLTGQVPREGHGQPMNSKLRISAITGGPSSPGGDGVLATGPGGGWHRERPFPR